MLKNVQHEFDRITDHLRQELAGIRTGRANPSLVESTPVAAYNSILPLVQLASITAPDSKTLVIQAWDQNLLKDIEKALLQSNLGMTPVNDGTSLRLTVPQLTEERRREYLKMLKQKVEQGKISLRQTRDHHLRGWREEKQQGRLSEDNFFAQQKELQKLIDDYAGRIDEMERKKEQEVMTV
ncbi:MAG: ribosome recycling factor [Candidatus Kerfeldbacteria bacterium]|nr:ribosome recycling factor [Candidatus Kerfeldbacteria bacterium]